MLCYWVYKLKGGGGASVTSALYSVVHTLQPLPILHTAGVYPPTEGQKPGVIVVALV